MQVMFTVAIFSCVVKASGTQMQGHTSLTVAAEACCDEHVGEERVQAYDAILVKGIVVIVASPGTV